MPEDVASHSNNSMRRLSAIMSADIAGYSRLMSHDEEGTHARLTRYKRDIVEPTVVEHHGNIVKHMGDGFLAIFDSPLEATRCAVVIQQTIAARNSAIADRTKWLQYRIGINLGDVIIEPHDIFGDGVNIAARLQTAAKPGDVNISGGVYEQVKNKLVCGYQSLGDERLKNITDPVRIYRVLPDPSAVERAEHRSRRVARTVIPMIAACVVTFVAGVWYATHRTSDAPQVASANYADDQASSDTARRSSSPQITRPTASQSSQPETARSETPPSTPPVAPPPEQVAVVAPPAPPPQTEPPSPANAFRDCQRCPELLKLPGGRFRMGNADEWTERPVHQVVVAPFSVARFPITRAEWQACVDAKVCRYEPSGSPDLPVRNVSWDDAQRYVAWLRETTSKPYRLPTEAEWEYAARGGTFTSYWWGPDLIPGVANCKACGTPHDPEKPIKISLLRPNPFGLYGMGGGVAEWVSDCWHSTYQGAPHTGSWDSANCREHVLRGGSWLSGPDDIKVTSRSRYDTGVRYPDHGFRVALTEK